MLLVLMLTYVGSLELTASLTEKHKAAEELDLALLQAEEVTQSGKGLVWQKQQAEAHLEEAKEALEVLALRKNIARRKLALVLRAIRALEKKYNVDLSTEEGLQSAQEYEREHVGAFIARLQSSAPTQQSGFALLFNLLTNTFGQITQKQRLKSAALDERLQSVSSVFMLERLREQEVALRDDYESTMRNYLEGWRVYQNAKEDVVAANKRIAEVKRITAEVDGQILRLQRELARIDAQLVARIERELIEKGLMSPQPGERSDGRIRSKQTFFWPVQGRISAGFYNAAYQAFFGVPHKGVDIVVGQGTAVSAAADGVVYLARNGGRYGYSYVLIGHRNGYATLYGHLSSISVSSGEDVRAGQLVGYSGGTPGTVGAGPMTTGAHLHFEVIRNGEHVDPLTILP